MAEKLAHPTPSQLSAFSLGQLSPTEAIYVETHITDCAPCCETLLQLADEDTFVGLLKEVNRAPSHATIDLPATTMSAACSDADEIPPALLNHPRYRVEALIGRGGMGDVYKAEHSMMQRTVALKVINRNLISKPEAVERFHREVRAAAQLHHPNIVTAYDAEQAGDTHFLAMEYVEGTELFEIVRRGGRLPVELACEYTRQVALGLQHAVELGMVHRDIKPQNLMATPAGEVKILDFGLANFVSESVAEAVVGDLSSTEFSARGLQHLTQLGTTMGTPDYIAPEQAEDARTADMRSDIYSLGCTLFYLLTGDPPFEEASVLEKIKAHISREPELLRRRRPEVPEALEAIVQRMMAKNPADRYQTPAEVVAALDELRDRLRPVLQTAAAGGGRRGHRLRWVAAAAAAVVFAVLVVVTDRGRLTIHSDAGEVQVVVKQGDSEIQAIDLKSGSQVTWLPTGKYELELVGGDNNVALSSSGFEMTRLGAVVVSATWSGEGEDAIESFPPGTPTTTQDNRESSLVGAEFQEDFNSLLRSTTPVLEDEERLDDVLKSHAPLLHAMGSEGAREMARLLAGLPRSATQELMQTGFLKWEFEKLDPKRQKAMTSFMTHVIEQTIKYGFPADLAEKAVAQFDNSDVGFAVITNSGSNSQYLLWFRITPDSLSPPMTFPIFGTIEERSDRAAQRTFEDQLDSLAEKSYSTSLHETE